ncbi:SH3 and cysteine-rich domain-containing protein 2-like isoform X2 [Myxocyprinus asiaticus]|uniref:SH3 and cysteine-rich domain-containing protein 2-like isoform X2 n=1 Tax=Myxocyprinus asiaticus TaxID=70543 RepID=UPI0022238A27|nr:SH3 and cysteine-rich domain-containing protein 2-like isoform X2 [Myxocyprinus asiaticus]
MSCSNGKDRELRIHERPCTADTSGTPAVKLLRLKRSLTFMRSKSVENFFQRSQNDTCLPSELFSGALPSSPSLFTGSACPSNSAAIHSPCISSNPSSGPASMSLQLRPLLMHCFLEHVFRRPTSCHLCKNIIVGNSKQGLRCKTCKMGVHLWCLSELSQQPCQGKSGMFKRNVSSPLLTSDRICVVNTQESRVQVDPVYATLRFGTSLSQTGQSSFGSFCESPTQSLDEEEPQQKNEFVSEEEKLTENTENYVCVPENVNSELEEISKVPKVHSFHTYVALYKFLPQEQNDLELHPGDRVQVIDDSNEEWWKGKCGDRVGFFPANFVQRVRPGERVWKVMQGVHGNKELGHMTVKEAQICVGKSEDTDGFLKVSSGKKRGLVPSDSLEEI